MKQVSQDSHETENQFRPDEDAACDVCGRLGAFHFGNRVVCRECYTDCGSCCPEFGKDDLWEFPGED